MSWASSFPEPLITPNGERLVTLRDAGAYITALPKAQHDAPQWQTAIHCLIEAADKGGPVEFARLGMMQALRPKPPAVYRSADTDTKWRNNYKLVRDR